MTIAVSPHLRMLEARSWNCRLLLDKTFTLAKMCRQEGLLLVLEPFRAYNV